MEKREVVKVFRAIAAAIEGLTEAELEQLILGNGRLVFTPNKKSKQNGGSDSVDTSEVWRKLNDCKDRDEARQVLSSVRSKGVLTNIARRHKIHVTKQDRREDIEKKLIEFVVGRKLRSQAIETLNLKGGC